MRPLTRLLACALLFAVAAAAGYALSTGFGRELLRRECESQLTRLLAGQVHIEQVRLRLVRGLWVEGGPIVVDYPGEGAGARGAMHASAASAHIDAFALITGRFRLNTVRIDGFGLEIGRSRAGAWQPHFVAKLLRGPDADAAPPPPSEAAEAIDDVDWEAPLSFAHASESVVRTLLRKPIVAKRLDMVGASVSLQDDYPTHSGAKPVALRFDASEATLDHGARDSGAVLVLDGTLSDERGAQGELEIRGTRDGADYRSSFSTPGLELATFRPYAALSNPRSALAGLLTGSYRIESSEAEHKTIEVSLTARELVGGLPFGARRLSLDSPSTSFEARIELHPGRVRIARAQLSGDEVAIAMSGVAERPLRSTTQARFSAALIDAGLPLLRRVVRGLPDAEARSFGRLLEPLRSGSISRFGLEGTAPLAQWRELSRGELLQLPAGFSVTAQVTDVAIGESDELADFEGQLEWREDRLALSELRGRWNGRPLPQLTLEVDGISRLVGVAPEDRLLATHARPLPGLATLWGLLTSSPEPGEARGWRLALDIDHLHHPTLYGPVSDARVEIAPQADGLLIELARGDWSGVPVRGEAVYRSTPVPQIEAWLRTEPTAPPREADGPRRANARGDAGPWLRGGLEASALGGPFHIDSLRGRVAMRGTTLRLERGEAKLSPGGLLAGRLEADLARSDSVPTKMAMALVRGDMGALAPAIGLPEDFVSGSVDLEVDLVGTLSPTSTLHLPLVGNITLRATEGVVRRSFPLLTAIANASEGFNPFATSSMIRYDTLDVNLEIDQGRISTEHFALDGPLRVFATGEIDLRHTPESIDAIVGLFLLRQADQLLGDVPLLKWVVPGRDRGLLGAYFEVKGPLADPAVRTMAAKSIAAPIADVLAAPFRALDGVRKFIMGGGDEPDARGAK